MRFLLPAFLMIAGLSCSPVEPLAAGDPAKGGAGISDTAKLEGKWQVIRVETDGTMAPDEFAEKIQMRFEKGFLLVKGLFGDNREVPCQLKLDPDKTPKTIDYADLGTKRAVLGIYELDGDRLKLCIITKERERPKEFKTEAGSNLTLMDLKRSK